MNAYEIIKRKRDGAELSRTEIEYLIQGFVSGSLPDYQMSAFLMAVFFRGMSFLETTILTECMMRSGDVLDLSSIPGIKVDKHSTGGVGDKVSLVLAPLVASCGIAVPMVSGRGLGHTGGTLDKLESIPGFATGLSPEQFIAQLKSIGVAMMGQTERMAPADGRMYALRDVTATVDSIPLISASIISKKLAEGMDALVLDVKTGSGAFMRRKADAVKLARTMVEIGRRMRKKMVALITSMDQPLGHAVGNALEVEESIMTLKGEGPDDLSEVTLALGAEMLVLGRRARNLGQARKLLEENISKGDALRKFREMVAAQGGDSGVVDDPARLPQGTLRVEVRASSRGLVETIDCLEIGLAAVALGAGRERVGSAVDPAVGILIQKKVGDRVGKGEPLGTIIANDQAKAEQARLRVQHAYSIGPRQRRPRLILGRVE